jgi:GT2 family glycosyltransferase
VKSREPHCSGGNDRVGSVDVSVVIVSWNVREFLRRCIQSILSTRNEAAVEIVVVDNASTDGSSEMVHVEFPEAILISNASNVGFGPANNIGLAIARGRYVFFLNPDTVLRQGALTKMIEFLDSEPDFDMVGPRLVGSDGTVQPACARTLPTVTLELFGALYLHRLPFIGRRLNNRLISPYDLGQEQEVDAISGAAIFARREILAQLGGFDESFLHTAEDMDLCLRLRQSGSRIFFLANSDVLHYGGQSRDLAPVRTGVLAFISMGEFFHRSRGQLHALMYRLIVRVIKMPMLLLVGVGKALLSWDSAGLRERLRLAKAIWTSQIDR